MVFGYLPFENDDQATLYRNIIAGEYEMPDTVSAECQNLIKGILNVDPMLRYSIQQIEADKWYNKFDHF